MAKQKTYIAIDLKSFYASVECKERNRDPLTTNLVVADKSRTEKTICLAVSPSLKSYGIPGRPRLFEVVQKVKEANNTRRWKALNRTFTGSSDDSTELNANPALEIDYIVAPPRMAYYLEYSTKIYSVYLKYIAPEDIFPYSIDEVFIDATNYLNTYQMTARLTDERLELSDEVIMKLNDQLNMIRDNIGTEQEISITYFVPDDKKSGGAYLTHSGIVKKIDEFERKLIMQDETVIPTEQISVIQGEMFKGLYE